MQSRYYLIILLLLSTQITCAQVNRNFETKYDELLSNQMTTDMVFKIGSITKQFTAVAILQLPEQGKLGLQDDITKYIADYPLSGWSKSRGEKDELIH